MQVCNFYTAQHTVGNTIHTSQTPSAPAPRATVCQPSERVRRGPTSAPTLPPLRSGRQPARGPHPTVAWANILLEGSLSAYSDRQGLAKPCGQGVLANTPTSEDYSAWMSPLKTSTMPYSTICREDSNFSMDTNFGWVVNLNSTQQTNTRESDSYNGEGSQSG